MKSIHAPLPKCLAVALAGLLLPLAAGAAPPEPHPVAGEIAALENIPVEDWMEMATGRTLTYRINGEIWAREYYHPGTNHVSLQRPNGQCMNGTWDYTAPHYCFHWDLEGTACFRHVRDEDRIWVIQTELGVDTPQVQEMTDVSDRPLICPPQGTS
jgi:hypothetical protein